MNTKNMNSIKIPLALSVLVTLFLFYIDEGYYNFKWMLDIGNWFIFMIYVFFLFSAQVVVIKAILYKNNNPTVRVLKYILGIALGIASAFWMFK
jgi:hypothetical protein